MVYACLSVNYKFNFYCKANKNFYPSLSVISHPDICSTINFQPKNLRKMDGQTYQIVHSCICTTDNILVVGGEYLYKEGSYKCKAILKEVLENGKWLRLMIHFTDRDKIMEISHLNNNSGYSGMWRLFDWREEMREEVEESIRMREYIVKNFKVKPRYSKQDYLASLNEDILVNALLHFNRIYDCKILEEKEMNLIWLAWILGKNLLDISNDLIMFEMTELEFDTEEYQITIESDVVKGVDLNLTKKFYELDKLYMEVLRETYYK
jgi:hypothetical protein